ncbi:L,D-transpeptidase-like protein [Crenobacter luteus]|uniref:L,D-transpeptidase n=1 Tax=Crenobacter luteus TaxID=1452487 RepID=UPI000B072A74|nr:L,D-transpeptidase [Crenobacter luteus]TCP15727.1 L,D-transpeptidase-like protein [Crenobacter luteus]
MASLGWKAGVAGVLGAVSLSVLAEVPQPDVLVQPTGWHVVVNLPQTRLFVYRDGVLHKSYPVAVGKTLTQTPVGDFSVTGIHRNPAWHVPKSIQEEMRRAGKPVQTVVPPGPDNPLGKVFIRFGEPRLGLGFHGTNAPGSVPGFRSHGCVRLKNDDALNLADTVPVGAAVTVSYQSVLLNEDEAGNLWLTAYRDQYNQSDVRLRTLATVLLDWQRARAIAVHGKRVDLALKARSGKPVCLTCKADGKPQHDGQLTAVRWLSAPATPAAPTAPEALPAVPAPPAEPGFVPQTAPKGMDVSVPSSSRAAAATGRRI